jgi:RNA polymerase primary sigma factor
MPGITPAFAHARTLRVTPQPTARAPGAARLGPVVAEREPAGARPGSTAACLTADQERDLVFAAQSGDDAARGRLVEAFMPAIAGVSRRYRRTPGVDREELMQEGVVGLLRAASRYDPQLGNPFWAYATWWVRQSMQQLVSEMTRPIVLSDRALRRLAKIKEARRVHTQSTRSEPTANELAEATGLDRRQVDDLLAVETRPRGLEEDVRSEDGSPTTLGDLVVDPRAEAEYGRVAVRVEFAALRDLTAGLEPRERAIVQAHYGLGHESETLRQIADRLDLSVERVRQIEVEALEKVREAATAPAMRPVGVDSGVARPNPSG